MRFRIEYIFTLLLVVSIVINNISAKEQAALSSDPAQPVQVRIQDLLDRMTLEEKLGQINIPTVYRRELGGNPEDFKRIQNTFDEGTGPDRGDDLEMKRQACRLFVLGRQRELIQAVEATGTPTVVVLINGRPLTINWTAEHVPAVVEAWLIGEQGGHAVADVIFGDYNPSGRLPITISRHAGQLPAFYFHKPSKEQRRNPGRRPTAYVDMPMEPLYPFGFGLSYTTFEYNNLQITPEETGPAGTVVVSCDVTNTGSIPGSETVQLYINDVISSVTTPVRLLKGFRKVYLEPAETKSVSMILRPYDLSLLDGNLERIVESGTFEIMIGKSCEDIDLRKELTIRTLNP